MMCLKANSNTKLQLLIKGLLLFSLALMSTIVNATTLKDISINQLEDNTVILELKFSKSFSKPITFATDNPARLVLDFSNVKNGVSENLSRREVKLAAVKDLAVVEANNRTRIVINLEQMVRYDVSSNGNSAIIRIGSSAEAVKPSLQQVNHNDVTNLKITNVDFRQGQDRSGKFIIDFSKTNIPVDIKEAGEEVTVTFIGAQIPRKFVRKLDVTDFGTPVEFIEIKQAGNNVEAKIKNNGYFENVSYQADKRFTVEIKPLTEQQQFIKQNKEDQFVGERLSLNFQDIEVRAVLQLIADFTGINMVASDAITGSVTLRLQNVPWDQALDIILKTKGLDKRQVGNVVLVAPTEEIAAREKLELEASKQVRELAPLKTEFVQINYAKASDLAQLLKAKENSILSSRGSVSVDARTNTLLIQDTVEKLTEVRDVIKTLDIPVRQVLIESRIVIANDDFEKALGIDFGIASKLSGKPTVGLASSRSGADSIATGTAADTVPAADRLNVSLPSGFSDTVAQGVLALAVAQLPGDTILDLELSALESEGLGTIVSSPRLITSNQSKAYIESGEEIPFQEATSSGATSTSFKKAVIRLEVVPQITPDDKIILDLTVNQDSKGEVLSSGEFAIDTREIKTQVLVNNGSTIVLGGIYQQAKSNNITRIPFLGKIPLLGWLFRSENKQDNRTELLIFVTPKIIKDDFTV